MACSGHVDLVGFLLFLLNLGHGQLQLGQAGLTLWPRLPRFFYPLANMAKARPQVGFTPAFSPGFDPGLARFLMQGHVH